MTESKLVWRLLQSRIGIILSLLLPVHIHAQQNLVASIEISNVETAYVDRPGDLYVLLKGNTLKKFDIEGVLVSEQTLDSPTTFDPRDGSRLFFYSQKSQRFAFFSQETKQDEAK